MNLAKHLVAVEELRALRQEWDAKSREPFDWELLGLPLAGRLVDLGRHVADAVEGGEAEAVLLSRALRYEAETGGLSSFHDWVNEAGRSIFDLVVACQETAGEALESDTRKPGRRHLCRWLLAGPGRREKLEDSIWCKANQLSDYLGCTEPVRVYLPAVIRYLEGIRALLPPLAAEIPDDTSLEAVRARVTAGDFGVIGRISRELRTHQRAFDEGHFRGAWLIRRFQFASKSSDRRLFTDENIRCFEREDMADLIGVVERAADSLAECRLDQAVETPTDVEPPRRRRRGRSPNRRLHERNRLIRDEYARDNSKSRPEIAKVLAERHKEDAGLGPFTKDTVRNALDGGPDRRRAGK